MEKILSGVCLPAPDRFYGVASVAGSEGILSGYGHNKMKLWCLNLRVMNEVDLNLKIYQKG